MAENFDAEMMLRILNEMPGAPWSFRLDPETMRSAWIYQSPQLAEVYALSEADVQGDPLSLVQRLPPEEGAALQQKLMRSLQTLEPMGWIERVVHPSGEVRWVEARVRLRREAGGELLVFGQSFDVTEHKRTEYLHREAIDAMPAVILAMTPDGEYPIYNRYARERLGSNPKLQAIDHPITYLRTDGVTPFPSDELPVTRALRGEEAPQAEMIVHYGPHQENTWIRVRATPIRDDAGRLIAGLTISLDFTDMRALEQELRARNAQLAESEEGKSLLIDRLRQAIDELENPVLEVWDDVLALPMIGAVDARRIGDVAQHLLLEVARTQASFVIVDLTGVESIDAVTAAHIIKLTRKVELVGARCVLTGIRPAVSEALVDMEVDFARITTLRNLKHGLREALHHARREREGRLDDGDFHHDGERKERRARVDTPRRQR